MSRAVVIAAPNPNAIYTITYTPSLSATTNLGLDVTSTTNGLFVEGGVGEETVLATDHVGDGSVLSLPANIYSLNVKRKGVEISKSDFYLSIILRRNTNDVTVTPAVEEYLLMTGIADVEKFL